MTKKKRKIEEKVKIPEGVKVKLDDCIIDFNDGKNTMEKNSSVNVEIKNNEIILSAKKATKRGKTLVGTCKAHINNMIKGVQEPYRYTLKICSGHFPMNVSVSNEEFIVKNFLGEKTPRVLKIKENVKVKVEDDLVIVESVNKNLAGQTSADIEKLCKITNRDPRVFQDGIWINNKAGKDIK